MRDTIEVEYRIDSRNSLVFINDAWISEAQAVPQPELASPAVLGRNLWDLITDLALRHIFEGLFHRLRTGQISSVTYRFRCDTPEARRLHHLTISPLPDQSLDFRTSIIAVSERPSARLLSPAFTRSAQQLRICGWCKRIPQPGRGWLEVEDALGDLPTFDTGPLPALTHGICPSCERTMFNLLHNPSATGGDIATFGAWKVP